MSHNPNTVKSQDDLIPCNDGKRSSDVLLSAIDELEILKTENKWYSEQLHAASEKCERLQKQLEIAVKCLEIYALEKLVVVSKDGSFTMELKNGSYSRAKQALKEIKELNK